MWLYEANYERLVLLFPGLRNAPCQTRLYIDGLATFCAEVVEHGPYTTTLTLCQGLGEDDRYVWDPRMRVRVYLDARLAEVIGYQQHRRFRPRYPYPNPEMLYPHEKRQVNLFLTEWLNHCVARALGRTVAL